MVDTRSSLNNKILLIGLRLTDNVDFYIYGGGKEAKATNNQVKVRETNLETKLKADPNLDVLITAMDLLGVDNAQDLYSLSFVIFFDATDPNKNAYIEKSLTAISRYRQPGDQAILVGISPANMLFSNTDIDIQVDPKLASKFKSLISIQYDHRVALDSVIQTCMQNLKTFILQENKKDLWQKEAKFIENLNQSSAGKMYLSIFRVKDPRITGLEDLLGEDEKSVKADDRLATVKILLNSYLDYLRTQGDPAHKTSHVQNLLQASETGIVKFAFTLGREEEFILAKRNAMDFRTGTGQELIANIHKTLPEISNSVDYQKGKTEADAERKLNNIRSLFEIYKASLETNITKAQEAQDFDTEERLQDINTHIKFISTLYDEGNPKSAVERLSDFAALFEQELISYIQATPLNQSRFSLFTSEPADVLIKGVYSIVPDLEEIRAHRKDIQPK